MAESDEFSSHVLPHVVIDNFQETTAFIYPPKDFPDLVVRGDFAQHGKTLLEQLAAALGPLPAPGDDLRIPLEGLQPGTIVRLNTEPVPDGKRSVASKLAASLELPAKDVVVLRSERGNDTTETALYFVPDAARENLERRVASYADPGNRKNTEAVRFQNIASVDPVSAQEIFIGDVDFNSVELGWWEFWVRSPKGRADALSAAAKEANFDVFADRLFFPETVVVFIHGRADDLLKFVERVPGAVSEVRRAAGTIETFLDRSGKGVGSKEFVEELLERINAVDDGAPAVCVLDTGVAGEHPLVKVGLTGAMAYNEAWGTDDHCPEGGHGTGMVGLVLYGDLEFPMNDKRIIELAHVAESIKILPPKSFKATDPAAYGTVTQGCVALAEINDPERQRTFCLAVSTDVFSPDRPSSWSGAIDQICSGSMGGDGDDLPASDRPKRLMIVAAGNVVEGNLASVLADTPVEDPAQSWNALTIGGYTAKAKLPLFTPFETVVGANDVSPFSRTSVELPTDLTPIKPEILFEAGNMVVDDTHLCDWHPAVSLLTTGSDVHNEPLVPFWATSAATGVAGQFFGKLHSALPGLWPETYRALAVSSADWPQPIRKLLVGKGMSWKGNNMGLRQKIIRRVGFGVPDIDRAIMSAKNDVTLIAQQEIQPYATNDAGDGIIYNEMHFYPLPWPKADLEKLENEIVTMKVTLSYFPEPNLSGRAATRPETYRSFGLRFDVKKLLDSQAKFRSRITASQAKDDTDGGGGPSRWLLGPKSVSAGSLHCDIWRGPAVELAAHDEIAVFPVTGWWKTHAGQKRMNDKARYSLVVSISARGQSVDLYSEIENLVAIKEMGILIG